MTFVENVRQRLAEDIIETRKEGEEPPTLLQNDRAMMLVKTISDHLTLPDDDIKFAVFVEGEGHLSVVMQCLTTDRRIRYEILGDGYECPPSTINENMQSELCPRVDVRSWSSVGPLIGWLITKPLDPPTQKEQTDED